MIKIAGNLPQITIFFLFLKNNFIFPLELLISGLIL